MLSTSAPARNVARFVNHVGRDETGEKDALGTEERPHPGLAMVDAGIRRRVLMRVLLADGPGTRMPSR